MIKVSVIVPVYKTEYKLLKRCIESLVKQTLKEIEILIVDDGSPDNCGYFCDEFAKEYEQIKVVHQENRGVSSARNTGISISQGEYIGFVDADDYVDHNYFEYLYRVAKEHLAEVVCSGYKLVKDGDVIICNTDTSASFYNMDKSHAIEEFLLFRKVDFRVWNKIFLADIAKKTLFCPDYRIAEDELFIYDCICKLKRITYTSYSGYYYFINNNSVMSSSFSEKNLDAIKVTDVIAKQLEEDNFQNEKILNFFRLNTYIRLWIKIVSDKELYIKYINEANYLKNKIKEIRFNKVNYNGNKTLKLFFVPIKLSATFTKFVLSKCRFIADRVSL